MNYEIKLSIIIPVYNVYQYLEKCIDSLLNQDFQDFEILLINDGSTDDSGQICETYKKKYRDKIKYYSKENAGLSDTRNFGIDKAQGQYIMFLDSDDYLENKLSIIMEDIEKNTPDILYFGYYKKFVDRDEKQFSFKSQSNKLYDTEDFLLSELKLRNLPIPACFGIYKKDLIFNNKLYFKKGILHEDERWTPTILLASKKIYTSDCIIYNYVQREGSITHKKDKTKNGLDLLETCIYLEEISNNLENYQLKRLLKNRISMVYMRAVTIGMLNRKKIKNNINRLFPLKNAFFFKDKIKALLFFINLDLYVFLNKKIKG